MKVVESVVSTDERRRRWRLKPIAWVILSVGALLLASALAWGVTQIVRGLGPAPLPPPATATPLPVTDHTPAPTAPPTPTLTPTPTAAYPITWTVRLSRDEKGRIIGIVDDPAVYAAVAQGFVEAVAWTNESKTPQNPADITRYYAPIPPDTDDPVFKPVKGVWDMEAASRRLQRMVEAHTLLYSWCEGGREIEVRRFSPDGRLAVADVVTHGPCYTEAYDTLTGQRKPLRIQDTGETVMTVKYPQPALYSVVGMVYDTADGRWKIATLWRFASREEGKDL